MYCIHAFNWQPACVGAGKDARWICKQGGHPVCRAEADVAETDRQLSSSSSPCMQHSSSISVMAVMVENSSDLHQAATTDHAMRSRQAQQSVCCFCSRLAPASASNVISVYTENSAAVTFWRTVRRRPTQSSRLRAWRLRIVIRRFSACQLALHTCRAL